MSAHYGSDPGRAVTPSPSRMCLSRSPQQEDGAGHPPFPSNKFYRFKIKRESDMMIKKYIIKEQECGCLMKDGRFVEMLTAGKYS